MQCRPAGAVSPQVSQQVGRAVPASRCVERLGEDASPYRRALRLFGAGGALAIAGLAFTGCESVSSLPARVQERFEAPRPQVRVFEAEQRAVFDAAQRALKRLDFVVSRAGAAQGLIKAHSPLHATTSFGKARQYSFELRVRSLDPGQTQVEAVLREQEESESFAGATDIPLREHGLYHSFFAALDAEMGKQGREPGMPPTTR